MDLHIRIFLGYAWLVAWLIVAAAAAALGFNQLGSQLEKGVTTTTRHIQATLVTVNALDQQDAAIHRALLGDTAARAEIKKGWSDLEKRLISPTSDETLDASAVERDLRWTLARYQQVADDLLAAADLEPVGARRGELLLAYEERVGEAYRAVKGQIYQLLEANVRSTVEREDSAVQTTRRYAFVYGIVLGLVLITVGYMSRLMRRGLVDRLVALAQVAQAVAVGERHRRATSGPEDELGIIARQFNYLLDHEQALQAEMQGRLCQQRQMLLGFVQDVGRPLALYSIYGDLAVTNLEGKSREDLLAAEFDFPKPARLEKEHTFQAHFGKRGIIRFRLLRVDQARPVGWLGEID